MAKIPDTQDPTLLAVDVAMEAAQETEPRPYLGASSLGGPCDRQLWYTFRWVKRRVIEASGLRRIDDGHRGETVLADRLRMVSGINLSTEKEPGVQHNFQDLGGHFRGNCDGLITGLLQSPKKLHVWECKIVNEQKFKKLMLLKNTRGEDLALKEWDAVYYGQAQIYMHYFKADRHYLTAGSPGVRDVTSVRTKYNEADALALIKKAERVIFADRAPTRISSDPAWHECRYCNFRGVCHETELPELKTCRSCMHSTPVGEGGWRCEKHNKALGLHEQRVGCSDHLFHPDMVPAEQLDYGEDWVSYRLKDGTIWKNETEK